MRNDPLVEEARQAGQRYIDSFKGDWKAIIADLQRRSREGGRQVISPPQHQVQMPSKPARETE